MMQLVCKTLKITKAHSNPLAILHVFGTTPVLIWYMTGTVINDDTELVLEIEIDTTVPAPHFYFAICSAHE